MFLVVVCGCIWLTTVFSGCSARQCCADTNQFFSDDGRCGGNAKIDFDCDGVHIPLNITDLGELGFSFLNNGSLIGQDGIIQYCETTIHVRDISYGGLIICYIPDTTFVAEENKIKVAAILGYVSLPFIICTIYIYWSIPILHDLQGICIINCLTGLAFGQTFLGVLQLADLYHAACETFALITYSAFMYMFFWLTILSFNIWKTTVDPQYLSAIRKWKFAYYYFATGGTFILLTVLLLSHYSDWIIFEGIRPGIGETSCWFVSIRETLIYFYAPISVLLCVNIICYVWTVVILSQRILHSRSKVLKYRLKVCVRLCIIMGITWVFEIITALIKNHVQFVGKVLIYILDIMNILQGFLIFLILVVFRKKVRRALANSNPCNITFPRSWKNLEDEETAYEDRTPIPTVQYTQTQLNQLI
ncbi:hypothetical protein GWI33_019117 [Rhynchophorus ferrugineus]|uniref:G-protein coupled receptors family 2 profile 2 domain-containing protein n=1 Tax=Rhynchophorus ferrugineus TaxID=354439 RepID=A0A834HYQ9_RHYFE|nr:hypothetical protein GWI33_019117 [Rhynchophorus ferrugineus]